MRKLLIPLVAALLAAAPTAQSRRDLVDTATAAGSFKTLLTAVDAAGLTAALRGEGPLTVFAPTDEAFAKLGKDAISKLLLPENRAQLAAILKHHVVAGRVDALAALQAKAATTLGGDSVTIRLEGGRLRVGDAQVVTNDIDASNGLIHVIDTVLMPPAKATIATEPRAAARQVLEQAVERGAPRFNGGDEKTCVELYDLALVAVVGMAKDLIPADVRAEAERARAAAARQADPKEAAWALRRGIDAVYRALEETPAAPVATPRRLQSRR